jgi:hypothetical protein
VKNFVRRIRAGGPMQTIDYAIGIPLCFTLGVCFHLALRYAGLLP